VITSIRLERFKRFLDLALPTSALTVLTGSNGAGKTSLLHALLLIRHASTGLTRDFLPVNDGEALQLGEASELVSHTSGSEAFTLTIVEGVEHRWTMQVPSEERSLYLRLTDKPVVYDGVLSYPSPEFTYICAERLGPRDVLNVSSVETDRLGPGTRGELTAQVLVARDRHDVPQRRRVPLGDAPHSTKLKHQVEAWMSAIVRPVLIDPQWVPGTLVASLRFKLPGIQAEWTRPTNMGFGVSYALPIIVAGLLVGQGGILIVENPEAHLHPAAQSRIGAFLARVAGDGVQVFVETHSDHVLNGIRRAVAQEALVPAEQVSVHYFQDDAGTPVVPLTLTQTGQLSAWPAGFFDQTQKDLAELARLKRRPR
jgi:predicted ATPase